MTTKNTSINIKLFECEKCVFRCSKKGDWNRHLLTRKHINATKTTENTSNTSNTLICECGKKYKERTALWRHKKKCKYEEEVENIEEETEEKNIDYKEMFLEMVNQMKKKDDQLDKLIPLL